MTRTLLLLNVLWNSKSWFMWQNILFNAIPCLRYVLQAMLSLGMQCRSFHKDTRYFFQVLLNVWGFSVQASMWACKASLLASILWSNKQANFPKEQLRVWAMPTKTSIHFWMDKQVESEILIDGFKSHVWDHPLKTSANFHKFWPLPPYRRQFFTTMPWQIW